MSIIKDDGTVIHFKNPKVQAAFEANIFCISGASENWRSVLQPQRKQKVVHKSAGTDDKKLMATLTKLNVNQIPAVEEVQKALHRSSRTNFTSYFM